MSAAEALPPVSPWRDTSRCEVAGCPDPRRKRQWCEIHYQRWRRHGDPLVVQIDRTLTPEERLLARINKEGAVPENAPHLGGCWLWTGPCPKGGYGVFYAIHGKATMAHRYAYELWVGPIPDGHEVDHLCYVPSCCRPDHLEAVTPAVNAARQLKALSTTCKHGHLFDEANTLIRPDGSRWCRACARRRRRAHRAKSADSPWRDTSHITDHIPTRAELAACPPTDPARLASHHETLVKLTTQAAWQPAPAPGCEPFTVAEMVADRLDEAADLFDALAEAGQKADRFDRDTDWPTNEKSGWE